ncbi:MAG TPA: hypothetical protein VFR70_07160, partial [Flavobacterium sp.]|nr:hypothetical protein [Flavobacterium sp.]
PFAIVLFVLQHFAMKSLSDGGMSFFYHAWSIYAFNVAATVLVSLFLIFVNSNFENYTGFAFLGASLFRMIAAIVFLLPLLKADIKDSTADMAAFFTPYFLFLLFETSFAIRLINKR